MKRGLSFILILILAISVVAALSISNFGNANVKGWLNVTDNATFNNYLCNSTACFSFEDLNKTGAASGGDNASWNQSFANTLYVNFSSFNSTQFGSGKIITILESWLTTLVGGASSGNYFNQQLNTTNNVTFAGINVSENYFYNNSGSRFSFEDFNRTGSNGVSSYTNIALTNQSNIFNGNITTGKIKILATTAGSETFFNISTTASPMVSINTFAEGINSYISKQPNSNVSLTFYNSRMDLGTLSAVFYSLGRQEIGIGTTTPTATLQVVGNVSITGTKAMITLASITLPACNSGVNGSIAKNLTGVYGCGNSGQWTKLF